MAVAAEWGLPALVDDGKIVVSELVANAVNASIGAGPEYPFRTWIAIRFSDTGRRFVIEVFDTAPGTPIVQANNPLAETGKGLRLVDALATWGSYAVATGSGKIVWAALDHPDTEVRSSNVLRPLPRRTSATPSGTASVPPDLALLHRVRDRLIALPGPHSSQAPIGAAPNAPSLISSSRWP